MLREMNLKLAKRFLKLVKEDDELFIYLSIKIVRVFLETSMIEPDDSRKAGVRLTKKGIEVLEKL